MHVLQNERGHGQGHKRRQAAHKGNLTHSTGRSISRCRRCRSARCRGRIRSCSRLDRSRRARNACRSVRCRQRSKVLARALRIANVRTVVVEDGHFRGTVLVQARLDIRGKVFIVAVAGGLVVVGRRALGRRGGSRLAGKNAVTEDATVVGNCLVGVDRRARAGAACSSRGIVAKRGTVVVEIVDIGVTVVFVETALDIRRELGVVAVAGRGVVVGAIAAGRGRDGGLAVKNALRETTWVSVVCGRLFFLFFFWLEKKTHALAVAAVATRRVRMDFMMMMMERVMK